MDAIGHESKTARDTWLVRISSVVGISACLGDLLMTYLLANWYPGYHSLLQPMSDLGHIDSPVASVASRWWVAIGLLFVFFGYGFYRAFSHQGRTARTAAWMIALYGLGEGLGSGLVRGTAGEGVFRTPAGAVHNMLGGVGVLAAVLLPFLIMKIHDARQSPCLHWYSAVTLAAAILFLVLFGIATFLDGKGSWISYKGLWQRLFMLVYYVFCMLLAVLMLTRPGEEGRATVHPSR